MIIYDMELVFLYVDSVLVFYDIGLVFDGFLV